MPQNNARTATTTNTTTKKTLFLIPLDMTERFTEAIIEATHLLN